MPSSSAPANQGSSVFASLLIGVISSLFGRKGGAAAGADSVELDLSHPPPAPRIAVQGLITADGDQRIVVPDVTATPWRPLVCLRMRYADGSHAVGTGLLIGPDLILTAAHNLFALDLGKFVESAVAEVGVKNGVAAASARFKRVDVCPGYTRQSLRNPSRYSVDFGLARVDSDALHRWAGMYVDVLAQEPIPNNELAQSLLNVAGYPDREGPLTLKTDSGGALPGTLTASNFRYKMDTMPGESGGPVFRYHKDTGAFVYAGVHVAGEAASNLARRYDPAMRAQLKAWLARG